MTDSIIYNGREFRVVSSTPAKAPAVRRKAHRTILRPLDGSPVNAGTLSLSMAPPSVNALFFNRGKRRGRTLSYRNWRAFADRELRDQPSWHVPGRVNVSIRVGGSRADADNLLKAALDALVNAGRIMDDRLVMEARAVHDSTVVGTLIEIQGVAP